jgi:DNA-binding PadR family transcriptional regulator
MEKPGPLSRLEHSLTYGNIWLAIFPLLRKRKEYAYALPGRIEKEFGFRPGKIMTYLVLYKLEESGLIEAKFEGRRKYYCLTAKGRKCSRDGKALLLRFAKRM